MFTNLFYAYGVLYAVRYFFKGIKGLFSTYEKELKKRKDFAEYQSELTDDAVMYSAAAQMGMRLSGWHFFIHSMKKLKKSASVGLFFLDIAWLVCGIFSRYTLFFIYIIAAFFFVLLRLTVPIKYAKYVFILSVVVQAALAAYVSYNYFTLYF